MAGKLCRVWRGESNIHPARELQSRNVRSRKPLQISACDVYEGVRKKEKSLAAVVDLKDAYNKVKFKLLMELHVYCGVGMMLTRAFQEERSPCF